MIYGINLTTPIKVGAIKNPEVYYEGHMGANLVFTVIDKNKSLVARGVGMQWNQSRQLSAQPEWGKKRVIEIVEGAILPGNLTFNSMNFFHLNDNLPTTPDYTNNGYLTCFVQTAEHNKPSARGLIIDVFRGVKFAAHSGNWNANSQYMMNGQMMFLERLTGLEWVAQNPDLANATADRAAYPAEAEK